MPKNQAPPPPPPASSRRSSSLRRRRAAAAALKQSYYCEEEREDDDDDDDDDENDNDDDDLNIEDWIGNSNNNKFKIKTKQHGSGGASGGENSDSLSENLEEKKKPAATKRKATNNKKPAAAKKRKRKQTSFASDEEEDCNDGSVDNEDEDHESREATTNEQQDDDGESPAAAIKPAATTAKQNKNSKPLLVSPTKKTCPHCRRTFGTATGAKYHVEHLVCRPADRPVPAQRRGKSPTPNKEKKNGNAAKKRGRGALQDRTCPSCRKVFTSALGLQYHRDHSVCDNTLKQANVVPFPTLQPGQLFATKFGVVEVVKDDRATPTAVLPPDIKPKLKLYGKNVAKREARIRREVVHAAVETRVRAKLLRRALVHNAEKTGGNVNVMNQQMVVADAYQRSVIPVPTIQRFSAEALRREREGLRDPSAPKDSHPDRIVECVLRPDRRPRYVGGEDKKNDNVLEGGGAADEEQQQQQQSTTMPLVKMFLARRLLTTPYRADGPLYQCPACWKWYSSKPGLSHHMAKETCAKRAEKEAEDKQRLEETIRKRSKQALARIAFQATVMNAAPLAKKKTVKEVSEAGETKTLVLEEAAPAPAAAKKEAPVLPAEPDDFRGPDGKFRGPRIKQHSGDADAEADVQPEKPAAGAAKKTLKKKRPPAKKLPSDVAKDVVHPDDVLAELEQELAQLQGQMLGPMYPGVWNSLGYKKPTVKKKKRKRKKPKGEGARKRQKQANVEEPAGSPPDPLDQTAVLDSSVVSEAAAPVVIDTRVLAAEVDSGRYPSIKRYHGDHDTKCSICKSTSNAAPAEVLGIRDRAVPCNFCPQTVHLSCVSSRFSVKDPEPGDDFMCHRCIGILASRRLRAEKRRLEKLNPGVEDAVALEEARVRDQRGLLHGLVAGREFECVAAQGRQVEDLSELLREAKSRLSLSNEMASMNRWRLNLLEDYAKDVKK